MSPKTGMKSWSDRPANKGVFLHEMRAFATQYLKEEKEPFARGKRHEESMSHFAIRMTPTTAGGDIVVQVPSTRRDIVRYMTDIRAAGGVECDFEEVVPRTYGRVMNNRLEKLVCQVVINKNNEGLPPTVDELRTIIHVSGALDDAWTIDHPLPCETAVRSFMERNDFITRNKKIMSRRRIPATTATVWHGVYRQVVDFADGLSLTLEEFGQALWNWDESCGELTCACAMPSCWIVAHHLSCVVLLLLLLLLLT